jgi:hypothetical protein
MLSPRPVKMDDDKNLNLYISKLITQLLEKNPKLAQQVKEQPELLSKLKMEVSKLLKQKFDRSGIEMTLKPMLEESFVKKLSTYVLSAMGIKQDKKLTDDIEKLLKPLLDNKEFMKEFEQKLQMMLDPKNKPEDFTKELEKLLNKYFPDKDFKKEMDAIAERCNQALKKSNVPELKMPNPLMNLTGLLCNEPGSLMVPQDHYAGNGNAFIDFNPNDGMANIDSINSVSKGAFGDPLGLIAGNVENYSKIEDTMVSEFVVTLENEGLSPNKRPSPFDTNMHR